MLVAKDIVIVTGLSGAGKTAALNALEDIGYLTMDNLPCELGAFIFRNYTAQDNKNKFSRLAIGIDIRSFSKIEEYHELIEAMEQVTNSYEVIYLDSSDQAILNRYNLTRRKHPLERNTLLESVHSEREIMLPIKEGAALVIDTSEISAKVLAEKIKNHHFKENEDLTELNIHIQSFGFKYGMPIDLDLVFDVRFLENPYYVPELREKNGNDKEVRDYVMKGGSAWTFYRKLLDMIEFLIPEYIREGKKHLSIGMGCSGGKHRSVTLAYILADELSKLEHVKIYRTDREKENGHWK